MECDRGIHQLAATLSVDFYVLTGSLSVQYHSCAKARTFNMNLHVGASRVANNRPSHIAGLLGKTTRNVVALVGLKLAAQIELVAVTFAAQFKIDLMVRAAARPVCCVTADALRWFVGGLDGTGARPVSVKIGKRPLGG